MATLTSQQKGEQHGSISGSRKKRQRVETTQSTPLLDGIDQPHEAKAAAKPDDSRSSQDLFSDSCDSDDNEKGCDDHDSNRDMLQSIGIIDNVLTADQCQELISIHEGHRHAGYIHHLTITRVADLATTPSSLAMALPLIHARHVCWQHVERYFDAALDLYPEFTALMAWHPGSFLQTHYDANRDYLQDRHYSAVLYLNDPADAKEEDDSGKSNTRRPTTFQGGDLVFEFPQQQCANTPKNNSSNNDDKTSSANDDLCVRPKAGRLVCFPSTNEYLHRVEEITSGTRYTLTMWFTRKESAMETLQSLQQQLPLVVHCQQILDDGSSSSSWRERLLLVPGEDAGKKVIEQPWETKEQAERLFHDTVIVQAKITWQESSKSWISPGLLATGDDLKEIVVAATDVDAAEMDNTTTLLRRILKEPSLLLQLIAYCWWKKGAALGTLVCKQEDVHGLVHEWMSYVQARFVGLQRASRRWLEHGMITNVTEEEMDLSTYV